MEAFWNCYDLLSVSLLLTCFLVFLCAICSELLTSVEIYRDHKICKATGNAERGHIKFPHTPKITNVGDLSKKKGKMVGKWKRSIDQCSKKSTKVLNRFSREKIDHTQNSLEHMVIEPESPMNLKEDLRIEQSSAMSRKIKSR